MNESFSASRESLGTVPISTSTLYSLLQRLVRRSGKAVITQSDQPLPAVLSGLGFETVLTDPDVDYMVSPDARHIMSIKSGTGEAYEDCVIGAIDFFSYDEANPWNEGNSNTTSLINGPIYVIQMSKVATQYQGKHIGRTMYKALYQWIASQNGALFSDSTLFAQSYRLWKKYMPEYANVFGLVMDSGLVLPITKGEMNHLKEVGRADARLKHVKCFAAMGLGSPSPKLIKIYQAVRGLVFSRGQYGVLSVDRAFADKLATTSTWERFLGYALSAGLESARSGEEGILPNMKVVLCLTKKGEVGTFTRDPSGGVKYKSQL